MAALWIHDLRNPESVANPEVKLNHPLVFSYFVSDGTFYCVEL
jgi:hypothetical protein